MEKIIDIKWQEVKHLFDAGFDLNIMSYACYGNIRSS